MKKITWIAVILAALFLAFTAGKIYAVTHMDIWANDNWDCEIVDGVRWYHMDETGDFDGTVWIDLDGTWYLHGLYVG